ncbi:Salicylate hydroxylase [Roseomonas mucosa]|uniref:FAD-dependent monooxygenase n=1 Tax=Roseomonas TaxID=125216 RepID=UPI0009674342|nr:MULTISPECIES: FAD-dependent monooxygenase [Roseomonas]ATR22095.1 salicylate hydroxylase [Roseomonas sp. FDAARGOS_362]USQ73242.1 FAD-dependent monooxygenase [Roseomonas mucosa]UZO95402.1 Salicylate hydroxylase [Roseomonas mucosa]GAV35661.1 6-hydroxynicotinate 3-monooxygenase precursor [Roseomonas sp. TAS13]
MPGSPIGIIGGGIGGLAAAIALHRAGREVLVFEQARRFSRVGADINLTPNAVRALDGLGIGAALREHGARPTHRVSRDWDTGTETSVLAMSGEAEAKYGAPQLTLHRADLLRALEEALPAECIRLGQRATRIAQDAAGVHLAFADGTRATVAALVGADGIHSVVRAALFGEEQPRFTGVVAYRAVIPRERLDLPGLDRFTKWWGPNAASQIVTFPISAGRETFIFATTPQESWREESWTTPGSVEELRAEYAGYHPEARALLAACDSVLKTALYERDPLPSWSRGRVTLLGDACHPMMPFMAQGAGMAVEDAVVLARCLHEGMADIPAALRRYERARLARTAEIQVASRGNAWLRAGGNADWVYGYDAWNVPLDTPPAAAA